MTRRVLMLHYTPPGVVGGAENVILQHAAALAARGVTVEVAAGRSGDTVLPTAVIPEIDAAGPQGSAVEAELAQGVVSPRFWRLRARVVAALRPLVQAADLTVVHNAFTLHFSLPFTAALWSLAGSGKGGKMVAWTHDLSWTNQLYLPQLHGGYPWDLLRQPCPRVRYIAVSETRRQELLALWNGRGPSVDVVSNGVDVAGFLQLSRRVREIAAHHRLFERDAVLLLPVRITRRKNIELGIRATAELVRRGQDVVYLISGPEAPHHPGRSRTYLEELKQLRAELTLENRVVFLSDELGENLEAGEIAQLYRLSDVLLFPSSHEGFGLPAIEAGLARVPAVLSDIGVLREVAGDDAVYIGLQDSADTIAGKIEETLRDSRARLFRRVMRDFSWDGIVDSAILPLLDGSAEGEASGRRPDYG